MDRDEHQEIRQTKKFREYKPKPSDVMEAKDWRQMLEEVKRRLANKAAPDGAK